MSEPKKNLSDTDRLVAAIDKQTQAIGSLVQSVESLVHTNTQLLEALAEIDGVEDIDEPQFYMDGTPINNA